jgi:hypothetical protein
MISPVTQLRLKLAAAGYSPLPVNGKAVHMPAWQTKLNSSVDEIASWEHEWRNYKNTGLLTRLTPALDIDIMHPEAAAAVEALTRQHFEERGIILVRFGRAPKRAILLRTNPEEAFGKLVRRFTGPDGKEHKIEVMADGEQLVAFGIHPDTKKPYSWHGGEPGQVKHDDLPYVREADIRALLDTAAAVLVEQFGFTDNGGSKRNKSNSTADSTAADEQQFNDPLDWGILFTCILAGENLHDTIRDLAASFVAVGMSDQAVIKRLQSLMTASKIEKDVRWRERYADIPRAVRTAREKFRQSNDDAGNDNQVYWHGEVDYRTSRPYLVQDCIPEVGHGLIAGQWGTFKTFGAFDLAHSCMSGEPWLGYEIMRRGGVLFIALEGGSEVPIRLQGLIEDRGKIEGPAPFAWIETCPPLIGKDAADEICAIAEPIAKQLQERFGVRLVLIIIDTIIAGAGYTKDGQDNDAAAGQAVMNTLKAVSKRMGCFTFGVDHFGKQIETGTRGTSAKEGSADVIIAMLGDRSVSGEVTNTRLALRKRRGGPNGEEHAFTAHKIDMDPDQFGKPMSTLVLDWRGTQDPQPAKERWSKSLRLLRQVLMTILADHGRNCQPYADGPTVRACDIALVRQEFCRQYPADGDEKKKAHTRLQAFYRAIKAAQEASLIAIRELNDVQLVWLTKPEAEQRSP